MKFTVPRETLLKPLQQIIGAVERRQTIPSLGNILVRNESGGLSLTATDLEIELVAYSDVQPEEPSEITLPARKLLDICRALPESAELKFATDGENGVLRSGRSRFKLSTLPAKDFPTLEDVQATQSFTVPQSELKVLFERTAFAMAQQDVRYYLNGLMLEVGKDMLRVVATDGHRLALCEHPNVGGDGEAQQIIIPRKGVTELQRLLADNDEDAKVEFGANHIRVQLPGLRFTSKLIDGRFPDYNRVLPKDDDKTLRTDKETLRQALTRASILSNEKYRGIRLSVADNTLKIQAHNPEQEEAEEELAVEFDGEPLEIGFNVTYLLDVLGAIEGDVVEMLLKDGNSSSLVRAPGSEESRYVVMPMRL